MRICQLTDEQTRCTENCKDCARDYYHDLKEMAGNAEFVTEEAIRNDLGDGAFEMLRKYDFIEYCATIEGRRLYAI